MSAPRRILFVQHGADLYGASRALLHLLAQLDRRRFQPLVALPEHGPLEAELRELAVEAVVAPYLQTIWGQIVRSWRVLPFGLAALPAGLRLRGLARRHGVALVHSNAWTVLTGALGAGLAGLPHIWHVREVLPPAGGLRAGLVRLSLGQSRRVICVSQAVASQFTGRRGAERVQVIYDGLPPERFATPPKPARAPSDPLVIGLVGRLHPQKGQADLLRAYALLPAELRARSRVALVGGASVGHEQLPAELEALARGLGIAGQVTFHGFVEHAPELIGSFDLLALPATRAEGLGGVLLEAMAARVPVLATSAGGIAEVVEHELSGLLVPPQQPAALAQALARLLSDAALRERLALAAHAVVAQRFNAANTAAQIMQIYDQILSS